MVSRNLTSADLDDGRSRVVHGAPVAERARRTRRHAGRRGRDSRAHAVGRRLLAGVVLALVARAATLDAGAQGAGVQLLRVARRAHLRLGRAGRVLRLGGRPRAAALVAGRTLALGDLLAGVLLGMTGAAVLLGGGRGLPVVESGDACVAGEARDLAGVLLIAGAVAVGTGGRLRLEVVHLADVAGEAVRRPEGSGRVARVAGRRDRGDVHSCVARRARIAVMRHLRDGVDAVVTVLTGRRRRRLPAVMRAAVGIVERGARLVTVEADSAVPGGAVVRQQSVGEGDRVVGTRLIPDVAALTAGGARRRERRGVLAGHVARPALLAGEALEVGVAELRAELVVERLAVVTVHALGDTVVAPAVVCRRGRRSEPESGRESAEERHGSEGHEHAFDDDQPRTSLPGARPAERPSSSAVTTLFTPSAPADGPFARTSRHAGLPPRLRG